MGANRVLYKNILDRHECKLRKSTSSVCELFCSYFVIYFGFLFKIDMNQSAQEILFTVKVLKTFLFSWHIFVFTIHIFPSDQSVNMLQNYHINEFLFRSVFLLSIIGSSSQSFSMPVSFLIAL